MTDGVAEAFQLQALLSPGLGSPLYGRLLEYALDDLKQGGLLAEVLDGWQGNAVTDALPLRLLGAVHRLVLDGAAPQLARYYPSTGGQPEWPGTWQAFTDVVRANREFVGARLHQQVQTNEVNRSAALLGGFLRIAERTGLPLHLLEIGCSAGLNLLWDQYRYAASDLEWGNPASSVVIRSVWHGAPRGLQAAVRVTARHGCDLAPIDVRDPQHVRALESFVWPDQIERLAQLRAAIDRARQYPPQIVRRTAAAWLRDELDSAASDMVTVVFHSIMWWYLPEAERSAVTQIIEQRGARSSKRSPLAWLQMEVRGRENADLVLRLWPGGEETLLATVHPHGREVWWIGE